MLPFLPVTSVPRLLPPRPIFGVGTIRSGSTLVVDCLGAHPAVCHVGFELSATWSRSGRAPMSVFENDDPGCPRLDEVDARAAGPEVVAALHRAFGERYRGAGGTGAERFLSKNPHLSNKLPYLRVFFPDAHLIVTARDLRSTVASVRAHWRRMHNDHGLRRYLPAASDACWSTAPPFDLSHVPDGERHRVFPGGSVSVIAEYWLRTYERIDTDARAFDRVAVVRHRDFVSDPQATLARLARELGLPDAGAIELPYPVEMGRNDRWRSLLTDHEQEQLDAFVDSHRTRFGRLESADTRF